MLFNDGSLGACGRNNYGQLGDSTNEDKVRTIVSTIVDEIPIRQLGVGPSANSVFFINDNGYTYSTGLNDRGQLGVGDTDNRNALTLVESSQNVVFEHLSASSDHTLSS